MDDPYSLLLFVALLGLSAFFSATETAFFALSPLRLKKLEDEGDTKAGEILSVLGNKQRILITLLFGNTLVNVVATAMATSFLLARIPSVPWLVDYGLADSTGFIVVLASGIMTVLLLVFGEITPKTLAIFNAMGFARLAITPLRLFIALFWPVYAIVGFVLDHLFPTFANWNQNLGSATSVEEIDSYFSLGEEVGIIERDEKEMISSVFEFGDTIVREVMVPRPDIIAVPINAQLDELLTLVRDDGHSRFPVFDGSLDRVVGILYVKDILIRLDEVRQSFDLFKMLRTPYFIPETKKLDDLLREFQKRKIHLAVVVDEFGGVSGLVSIEDLLEEIVGEIVDEYDFDEQDPLNPIEENVYSVDARYSIEDLEDELDLTLEYEDSETVGGFVLEKLGRIPKRGETVDEPSAVFQVSEVKGNRILRVKVTKKSQLQETAESVS